MSHGQMKHKKRYVHTYIYILICEYTYEIMCNSVINIALHCYMIVMIALIYTWSIILRMWFHNHQCICLMCYTSILYSSIIAICHAHACMYICHAHALHIIAHFSCTNFTILCHSYSTSHLHCLHDLILHVCT